MAPSRKFLTLTLLLLTLTCKVKAEVSYGQSSYLYIQDRLQWADAKQRCKDLGGKLAEIEDQDEQDFLTQLFLNYSENIGDKAWIGLNDIANEGVFVWDSTGLPATYVHWLPGQPNNRGGDEDCADMWLRSSGVFWNDGQCTKDTPDTICELPLTNQMTLTCQPKSGGFSKHDGKCHVNAEWTNQAHFRLECLDLCRTDSACQGVNVISNQIGDVTCGYVAVAVTDDAIVTPAAGIQCTFWERVC